MSDLFSIYESSLKDCLIKIQSKTEEIYNNLSNHSSKSPNETNDSSDKSNDSLSASFSEAYILTSDGENLLKQMKIASNPNISIYSSKINEYSDTLNKYKKTLKNYEEKMKEKNINEKFGFDEDKNNLKNKLITNEEYGYSSMQKLNEAKRILSSTENVGNNIMVNMEEQTNKMKSVNVKIKSMNDNLDNSNSIMGRMQGILQRNKKIVILFGLFSIGLFILIMSIKIIGKNNKKK